MEDQLSLEELQAYKTKWQKILKEYNQFLQEGLNERNKDFKKDGIQKGDLVLMRNETAHKESLKFYRNLYQVTEIRHAKYFCHPLFAGTAGVVHVHGNKLKPYSSSDLFQLLTPDIRFLMGDSLTADEMKNLQTRDPTLVPRDFRDWRSMAVPPAMRLRNRLTPASLTSAPAVSLPDSDLITKLTQSSESESSTNISRDGSSDSNSRSSSSGSSGPQGPGGAGRPGRRR